MSESGVFRRKLFGGFNKKDVFNYYNELTQTFNADHITLLHDIEAQKEQLAEKDKRISELEQALVNFKRGYDKLDRRVEQTQQECELKCEQAQQECEQKCEQAAAELEQLRADKLAAEQELENYRGADSFKARFETLMQKHTKLQSDLVLMKAALQKERSHSTELESLVAQLSDIVNRTDGIKNRVDAALRRHKNQGMN